MPDGTIGGGEPLLRLASWNVNSIRTRLDRVPDWLARAEVDVLAMQETKCADDQFPALPFYELGDVVAHCGNNQCNHLAGRVRRRRGRLRRPAQLEQQAGCGGRRGSPCVSRHLRRRAGMELARAQWPRPE